MRAGFKAVYAKVTTINVPEILSSLEFSYDSKVEYIKNRTNTGPCPMEKIYAQSLNTKDLMRKISMFLTRSSSEKI